MLDRNAVPSPITRPAPLPVRSRHWRVGDRSIGQLGKRVTATFKDGPKWSYLVLGDMGQLLERLTRLTRRAVASTNPGLKVDSDWDLYQEAARE